MASLYLFDTNILVHLVRADRTGAHITRSYRPLVALPRPFISVVTEGELQSLAYQWFWGQQRVEQMSFLLDYFQHILLGDSNIYEAHALIDSYSEQQGRTMGKNDLWIAAAAYVMGATLVTTDKDFAHLQPLFLSLDLIELAVESET